MKKKIIAILVLAFGLRLISINQSLWIDEATTALVGKVSLKTYFTEFSPNDFHPPFYYVFIHFWVLAFGNSEMSLRMPSIIAGISTIWLTYKITKLISSQKFAKTNIGKWEISEIAAMFVATSSLHIYYSQEARMYALASFFVALSIYLYLKEKWIPFSLTLALIFLTHYVAIFIVPVFWILGLINKKKRRWWETFIYAHVPLVSAVTIWMPFFIKQFFSGMNVASVHPNWWNILGKTSFKEIVLVPAKFIFGRISLDNNFIYGLLVVFVGIIYALIVFSRQKVKSKTSLVWFWFFIPLITTLALGLFIPVFNYFRLLFIIPALFILLSQGISNLKGKWQIGAFAFILVVNLVSTGVYLFNPRFHREDWKGLVDHVRIESSQSTEPVTLFVADSQMEAYNYYSFEDYKKELQKIRKDELTYIPSSQIPPAISPESLDASYSTIWLMRYVQPIFDPEDTVRMKLESMGYEKISEHDFNGVVVWRYEK